MSHTTIVIPCYNEASRLDVDRFVEYGLTHPGERFLFVDDGSTDATRHLLQELCEYDPRQFELVALSNNTGKAEAVRQGVLAALVARPAFVGYWDADLATPLEAIAPLRAMFERLPQLSMVMGSRVRLLGRQIERKLVRHLLGRVFATGASLVLGLGVYDTQCGAKLLRVDEGTSELFTRPFLTNWIFDVEILARMIQRQYQCGGARVEDIVYEFPLVQWQDVCGSKVRPRDFFKAARELLAIYRAYLRPTRSATHPRQQFPSGTTVPPVAIPAPERSELVNK